MTFKHDDSADCNFTYTDGRRCRMPKPSRDVSYCAYHFERTERMLLHPENPFDLIDLKLDLQSAQGINQALAKVFRLVVLEWIPPRNAALLTYICQLLLQTVPQARKEDNAVFQAWLKAFGRNGLRDIVKAAIAPTAVSMSGLVPTTGSTSGLVPTTGSMSGLADQLPALKPNGDAKTPITADTSEVVATQPDR